MTDFTVASFNARDLIGPDRGWYRFANFAPEAPFSGRARDRRRIMAHGRPGAGPR